MRGFLLLFLAVMLGACAPGPVSEVNPHTGVASRASGVLTIDRRYPARLEVRAVRLAKAGAEEFALLTFVTRDDLNYPRIERVWSFGRALPYARIDRRRIGFARQEAGAIRLSRGAVEAAARTGLTFQMIGPRGTYGGTVPARLFGEILAR